MKPVPRRWRGALHLPVYHRTNSKRAIHRAARRKIKRLRAVDIDALCTKDLVVIGCHWRDPIKHDGFRDPLNLLRSPMDVCKLQWRTVKRLRTDDGYRIEQIEDLMVEAARLGVRVELELKDAPQFEDHNTAVAILRPLRELADDIGLDVQVKTLSNIGKPGARLRAAEAAGFTTILLRRGPIRRWWKRVTDFIRG